MDAELIIKTASTELLDSLKSIVGGDAREIQDLSLQIEAAFAASLATMEPNAMEELSARSKALLELSRLTAIRLKREAIMASILTAAKVARSLIIAL